MVPDRRSALGCSVAPAATPSAAPDKAVHRQDDATSNDYSSHGCLHSGRQTRSHRGRVARWDACLGTFLGPGFDQYLSAHPKGSRSSAFARALPQRYRSYLINHDYQTPGTPVRWAASLSPELPFYPTLKMPGRTLKRALRGWLHGKVLMAKSI